MRRSSCWGWQGGVAGERESVNASITRVTPPSSVIRAGDTAADRLNAFRKAAPVEYPSKCATDSTVRSGSSRHFAARSNRPHSKI